MNNTHFCLLSQNLFDFSHTIAAPLLQSTAYPWEVLPLIDEFIKELGTLLDPAVYEHDGDGIFVAKSARVASSAHVGGPCIIGEGAEIRHCALIRGSAIVGAGAVVGNSTELKNCVLFDAVQVPHYNYVGDSILGNGAHMGAGSICSNLKSDKKPVVIRGEEVYETGLRKVGAILADGADIGCGCVLNPGTVIGKNTSVYPLTAVRGVIEGDCIVKSMQKIVKRR